MRYIDESTNTLPVKYKVVCTNTYKILYRLIALTAHAFTTQNLVKTLFTTVRLFDQNIYAPVQDSCLRIEE
jgi:hypothetical protein